MDMECPHCGYFAEIAPAARQATVLWCPDCQQPFEEIVTTEGYTPEEQAAYCANYCAGEHHPACARRTEVDGGAPDA